VSFPGDRGDRSFGLQLERALDLAAGTARTASPSLADGRAALDLAERIAALAADRRSERQGVTT
jgi:hypothetical protein